MIRNHDINRDGTTRRFINETFERIYGPSYYSFDHGPTHFVVVDNLDWLHNPASGESKYRGGIGPAQLKFIQTDLDQIPKDQMVVLLMHIPLTNIHDRHGLYRLIEKRLFFISASGHTPHHHHVWITDKDGWEGSKPHHHIINVTVCGSWWSGAPDERGIPHTTMARLTAIRYCPSTERTAVSIFVQPDGRLHYQMEIDAPEVIRQADLTKDTISANVFNGSNRTRVELRVGDGEWRRMTKVNVIDPKLQRVHVYEVKVLAKSKAWRELTAPKPSTHLWQISLPAGVPKGTHSLTVRATDLQGRVSKGNGIVRIAE